MANGSLGKGLPRLHTIRMCPTIFYILSFEKNPRKSILLPLICLIDVGFQLIEYLGVELIEYLVGFEVIVLCQCEIH